MFKARRRKYYRLIIKQDITSGVIYVFWNEMKKIKKPEARELALMDTHASDFSSERRQRTRTLGKHYNLLKDDVGKTVFRYARSIQKSPIIFYPPMEW